MNYNILPFRSPETPESHKLRHLEQQYPNIPFLNICYNYNPPQTFVHPCNKEKDAIATCEAREACEACEARKARDNKLLYKVHLKILNEIKNKSLVISVLCSKSCTLFSRIRTFINIPLILSSGAMTILNSMTGDYGDSGDSGSSGDIGDYNGIKYANIVVNSCTVTIISLIGNFKLAEREITYRQTHIRMKRLYHQVDTILRTEPTKITTEYVGNITKEYVNIYEHLEYPVPKYIIKQFNKDLEKDAVTKKKQTKQTSQESQESQESKESKEIQESDESDESDDSQEIQESDDSEESDESDESDYRQEMPTMPVNSDNVLFDSELTFADNLTNDDFVKDAFLKESFSRNV